MAEYKDARIELMKVPIDSIEPESLEARIKSFIQDGKSHQIILLSLWDFMRVRRNAEWRAMASKASLIIPISKSLQSGARCLKGWRCRYEPFDFIISSQHRKMGAILWVPQRPFSPPRTCQTFGPAGSRYSGLSKNVEPKVLEAIRKAAYLMSDAASGRGRWLGRRC